MSVETPGQSPHGIRRSECGIERRSGRTVMVDSAGCCPGYVEASVASKDVPEAP